MLAGEKAVIFAAANFSGPWWRGCVLTLWLQIYFYTVLPNAGCPATPDFKVWQMGRQGKFQLVLPSANLDHHDCSYADNTNHVLLHSTTHVNRAWMKLLITLLSTILVLLPGRVIADTNYTACDPTKTSNCPPDPGFQSSTTFIDFQKPYPDGLVTLFSTNSITRDSNGLHITINAVGEEPFVETDGIVL